MIVTREYTINTGGKLNMTAVLVSDVHELATDELKGVISDCAPDVIFIVGDLMEAKKPWMASIVDGSQNSYDFLRYLVSIAPVYYGLGNHETYLSDEKKRRAEKTGAVLLENAHETVRIGDNVFTVGAVGPRGNDDWLHTFSAISGYKIFICHEPDRYVNDYKSVKADLVLSGHAHGGQWRLGRLAAFAPGQGILPKYTIGRYGKLIVSAGASNPVPIPRINNPQDIVKIRFI